MGGRRRRRGPRGTRRWTRPCGGPGRKPSSSPTAGTIRRKTSCSAWPAVRVPGRWRACRPAAGPTGGRCCRSAGPRCGPPVPRLACSRGTTRTTLTPPIPGRGSATRRCPRWRRARPGRRRGPGPQRQPAPGRCRGAGRPRRQPGGAGARRRRCLAGRPGWPAGRDQDPGAAPGRHRRRLPGRRADGAAHRGPGRPGHVLAWAAMDGPARRYPWHAPLWQAAFHRQ